MSCQVEFFFAIFFPALLILWFNASGGAFDPSIQNRGVFVGSSGIATIGSTGDYVGPLDDGGAGGAVELESASVAILLPTKIFQLPRRKCLYGGNGVQSSVKLIAFDAGSGSISASQAHLDCDIDTN